MISFAYKVSARGNACGLIVVALPAEGAQKKLIQFEIYPKFWAKQSSSKGLALDEILGKQGATSAIHRVQLHEGDVVSFFSEDVGLLRRLDRVLRLPVFSASANNEMEEVADKVFFELIGVPESKPIQSAPEYNEAMHQDFWELVNATTGGLQLIEIADPDKIDFSTQDTYLSTSSGIFNASYKQVLFRKLIDQASRFVSRWPNLFEDLIIQSSVFKGTPTQRGWINLFSKRTNIYEFSTSDIQKHTIWTQLVAEALLVCEADLRGTDAESLKERVWALHRQLHSHSLRLSPLDFKAPIRISLPRKLRSNQQLFELALAVLRESYELSLGSQENDGLMPVASVRVKTSSLFEKILDERVISDGLQFSLSLAPNLTIRDVDVTTKRPDLAIVSSGELVALADAKYKSKPSTFGQMPMGDQYQQYTYAQVAGLPTLFIYVGETAFVAASTYLHSVPDGARVGILSIPFPPDGDLETWWESVLQSLRSQYGSGVSQFLFDRLSSLGAQD